MNARPSILRHVILGLLRDGAPRHGYALRKDYRLRTGVHACTGRFYRELHRLVDDGLVRRVANPPGSDPRRRLYAVTPSGMAAFDAWLGQREIGFGELRDDRVCARAIFLCNARADVARSVFTAWKEDASVRAAKVAQAREAAERRVGRPRLDPLPLLLARRLKMIVADLEFIEALRVAWERSAATAADCVDVGARALPLSAVAGGTARGHSRARPGEPRLRLTPSRAPGR